MKKKITCEILSNDRIATGIYSMWIKYEDAADVIPGQFVGVYPSDKATLLPRPISICESDTDKGAIRLVYRVVGKGTEEFSHLASGDKAGILGVLGNGYDLTTVEGKASPVLMAGGIGIPPMLELAKKISGKGIRPSVVLGYRDSETFLAKEFEGYANVYIATDDGSKGFHGNVIDAMSDYKLTPDIIYACGPMPMLRGVKAHSERADIPAYISLEERMACGVGACLGCVCKTKNTDHHSHVKNARICTDGPIFDAAEVDI